MRVVLAITVALALPAAASHAGDAKAPRGAAIAMAHCARCHAVGRRGTSPLAEAPPFRALHRRYPVTDLAESLVEGITTKHPAMPEFCLEPEEADDRIVYLGTLAR